MQEAYVHHQVTYSSKIPFAICYKHISQSTTNAGLQPPPLLQPHPNVMLTFLILGNFLRPLEQFFSSIFHLFYRV